MICHRENVRAPTEWWLFHKMLSNKRQTTYPKFDGCSTTIRNGVLKLYADSYIHNLDENRGKCKWDFMKSLVNETTLSAPSLEVTHADGKNEVQRIKKKKAEGDENMN